MNGKINYFCIVFFTAFVIISLSNPAQGKTLNVGDDDGYYKTISAALQAAAEGDIIKVNGGIYNEEIVINTPNITIEAADPQDIPAIDGADQTFLSSHPTWEK